MSNMRQIARLAGVSVATVSLALHDHPRISAQTREKVKEIARKLNYAFTNQQAARFSDGKVIGYIIHENFTMIATAILRGAMEEAWRHRIGIVTMQIGQNARWIEEAIANLLEMGISGLVLAHSYPEPLPRRILLAVRSRGIHVVQIMHKIFTVPLDSVCRNERDYARVAAEHLAALGHRRVLGVSLPEDDSVWAPEFHACGIATDFIHYASGAEMMRQVFASFVRMEPRPTAIIVWIDGDAYRIINIARQHGLRVPEDLSVIGLGGESGAAWYDDVTSIEIQSMDMGRVGVRLLADRMAAGIPPHEITDFQDILLPAHLINHGSTGPAPT